ncbi:MAG: NAD(P)-binding domain-containing protein, partial [Verrucomicrobiae bacterium]|nr:NAD(P)-binding domain-containing protein [Verrucomicrobiae bacterium]
MKVGFLGAGRMATALAKGLINRSVCGPGQITAYDVSEDQRRAFSESTGAWVVDNNAEVARRADVLIVAVKPAHVAEVLKDVSTAYSKQLIISIAAGV